MRLPNGYGNVSKLPGNRRKPYRVRVTVGWETDEAAGTIKQKFKTIGYYETREEGLIALSNYHQTPFNTQITFEEVYQKWATEHFPKTSEANAKCYQGLYNQVCPPLYKMRFADIRKSHLQRVIDSSGKNYPTLKKLRVLFTQLFKYALQNDICSKDYAKFIDISQYKDKNPNAIERKPFTKEEIQTLWSKADSNEYISVVLMLIYSGVRVGELLDLKKENVNLSEKWFDVIASKTEAGVRKVPIADKVLPFFEHWMQKDGCEYLVTTAKGKHFDYRNYYDYYWKNVLAQIGMEHRPHDTRHTCVSMLTAAGVDDKIIKKIVGHRGGSVTEVVYTHFEFQKLIEAINRI